MANPLKILTDLQVSGTLGTSGSLSVGGNGSLTVANGATVTAGGLTVSSGVTSVGALTASSALLTTADINGGTIDGATIATSDITVGAGKTLNVSAGTLTLAAGQVGADKVSAGTFDAGTYSFAGSTISAADAITASNLTVTGDVTFGGNIVADANENKSIFAAVTSNTITVGAAGATVSIPGTGSIGGNLTVAGNLTVNGTTTTVNSQNLLVQDPVLLIGSGSGGHADGDRGFIFDLAAGNKSFYWDNSESKFTLVATTTDGTTNTIVPGALQTLSVGQLFFSASAQDAVSGQIYESGSNSVETALGNVAGVLSDLMNNSLQPYQVQDAYKRVRFAASTSLLSNNRAIITLSAVNAIGQNTLNNGNFANDRICTGSALTGMSGSSASDLSNKLAQLSFDVTVRASGSSTWTNDLLSVQVAPVQSGSDWYPQFTIDAPGLGDGQGAHLVRLVAVNEYGQDFLIV